MTVKNDIMAQVGKDSCQWFLQSRWQNRESQSLRHPMSQLSRQRKNSLGWEWYSSLTRTSRTERSKLNRVYLHTVVSLMARSVSRLRRLRRVSQLLCLQLQIWFHSKLKQTDKMDTHTSSKPRKWPRTNHLSFRIKQPCLSNKAHQKINLKKKTESYSCLWTIQFTI